jgi:hypothetical protein
MIWLQSATQPSQINTPGPATNHVTWSLDFPQKEHRRVSRTRAIAYKATPAKLVDSKDPVTGEPIRMTVTPAGIADLTPAEPSSPS